MPLHIRPLRKNDAVHRRAAHRAVAPHGVMAQNAVLLRAERLDRALRPEVEIIRAQSEHLALQRVERMSEQQQLARGVDMALLPALGVPGPADLDAVRVLDDVVIARAAGDLAASE